MINRRNFLTTLSASALLPVLPALGTTQEPASANPSQPRIDLNGEWDRVVGPSYVDKITVPGSMRPRGCYRLRKEFSLSRLSPGRRAYIHFEAITYFGQVSVNGMQVGTMGPYVPYEFEFTSAAKEGANQVEITIADLIPTKDGGGKDELAVGVNPGWEAYGGIIRDVYIELRPSAFIENARFGYKLNGSFTRAECRTQVYVSSRAPASGQVEVALMRGDAEVARSGKTAQLKTGENEVEIAFDVNDPLLWSPEEPQLYQLRVHLRSGDAESLWERRTGFRDVRTEGREFRLNGDRLVLHGVCRHDMWKDEGFTLTRAQQEQDMRMIKTLGCNFVRLVHYPHDRHIVELADELGLLVSEEPGYWNMNFRTMGRGEVEVGFRIMEGVIRRDWNSPSVFAWLLSNECTLTVDVLKEGKALCNRLDPIGRLVSAANSMPNTKAKPIFEQADMDFFDDHRYTFDEDEFEQQAEFYGPSKPLTFTEWGGKAIGQSQIVMQNTVTRLIELADAGLIAGSCFWSWQDVRQYSRIDDEMKNGVLESGVVTEARDPRDVVYMELARLCEGRKEFTPAERPGVLPLRTVPWSRKSAFHSVDLEPLASSAAGKQSWDAFESQMAKYWPTTDFVRDHWSRTGNRFRLWPQLELEIGGVPFRIPSIEGYARPLIVTTEFPEITIPVQRECSRIHILGHVTIPTGFPGEVEEGAVVGVYKLNSNAGRTVEIPLRNGYEVARANLIYGATRVDAVATEAQSALYYIKDQACEHYQVLLYSAPVDAGGLSSLTLTLRPGQPSLAVFAVTIE